MSRRLASSPQAHSPFLQFFMGAVASWIRIFDDKSKIDLMKFHD